MTLSVALDPEVAWEDGRIRLTLSNLGSVDDFALGNPTIEGAQVLSSKLHEARYSALLQPEKDVKAIRVNAPLRRDQTIRMVYLRIELSPLRAVPELDPSEPWVRPDVSRVFVFSSKWAEKGVLQLAVGLLHPGFTFQGAPTATAGKLLSSGLQGEGRHCRPRESSRRHPRPSHPVSR